MSPAASIVVGTLLAVDDSGRVAWVRYDGQPGSAALPAQSTVDLIAAQIGRPVVLAFERGDTERPIVVGVMNNSFGWPLPERPGQVDIDVDGKRLAVSAENQLVLRCGKASIVLTRSGKILIEGTYVSSHATGTHRIQGGSVQLN